MSSDVHVFKKRMRAGVRLKGFQGVQIKGVYGSVRVHKKRTLQISTELKRR